MRRPGNKLNWNRRQSESPCECSCVEVSSADRTEEYLNMRNGNRQEWRRISFKCDEESVLCVRHPVGQSVGVERIIRSYVLSHAPLYPRYQHCQTATRLLPLFVYVQLFILLCQAAACGNGSPPPPLCMCVRTCVL